MRCLPQSRSAFTPEPSQMDLYIDGNIAQMFSPEGAMRYFARLLGVDARSLRPIVSQERPHPFFLTSPAVENVRSSLAINGRPLDYAISRAGTIVPQRMRSSGTPKDARRQSNVLLNMPIFFVHDDRVTLGLPLLRAVAGGTDRPEATLLGAGDATPVGNCSTMYIRINVCTSTIVHICFGIVLLKPLFSSGQVTANGVHKS